MDDIPRGRTRTAVVTSLETSAAINPEASVALFEDRAIRRVWHEGRWFFSVVDVVGLLSESAEPRRYWSDLKRRVQDEGYRELYARCVQLKLPSPDGKLRASDAADAETLLRIVQSIPSPAAEPVKQWLARTGTERLEDLERPERAIERARHIYALQGYSADWIEKRLQGMLARQELTEEWRSRGADQDGDFARLSDVLARGTFGVSEDEHKAYKGLERAHNLRDSMTTLELALTTLAEATATAIHQAHESQGLPALREDVREAGHVAGAARRDIETRTGQQVVSPQNFTALTSRQRGLLNTENTEANGGRGGATSNAEDAENTEGRREQESMRKETEDTEEEG